MNTEKVVAKFVYARCECGMHMIDLFDPLWDNDKFGAYECEDCKQPLVCRGLDGHFYFVGKRIK